LEYLPFSESEANDEMPETTGMLAFRASLGIMQRKTVQENQLGFAIVQTRDASLSRRENILRNQTEAKRLKRVIYLYRRWNPLSRILVTFL